MATRSRHYAGGPAPMLVCDDTWSGDELDRRAFLQWFDAVFAPAPPLHAGAHRPDWRTDREERERLLRAAADAGTCGQVPAKDAP